MRQMPHRILKEFLQQKNFLGFILLAESCEALLPP